MRVRHRVRVVTIGIAVAWLALCPGQSPALAIPRWLWPVPTNHSLSTPYRAPASPYGPGHRGIDILVAEGTAIVSPASGTLAVAQWVVDRDVVTLRVDSDWLISFDGATGDVPVGSAVSGGQTLAHVAPTPHCSCVHVGVRFRGDYVNPMLIWGEVPRAVLLPW